MTFLSDNLYVKLYIRGRDEITLVKLSTLLSAQCAVKTHFVAEPGIRAALIWLALLEMRFIADKNKPVESGPATPKIRFSLPFFILYAFFPKSSNTLLIGADGFGK